MLRVPLWEAGPKHLQFISYCCSPVQWCNAMEVLTGSSSLSWDLLSTMVPLVEEGQGWCTHSGTLSFVVTIKVKKAWRMNHTRQ